MNRHILEKIQIPQGFLPVSLDAGANPGDWISLKSYARCAIVFYKAIGTPGDDPVLSFKQAKDVTGASSKALSVTRVDKKQAATNLLAVQTFTTSTSAAPATNDVFDTTAGTWSNTDLAEQAAIVVVDIKAEDLDINNGYDCIQISVADVGANADLGSALYLLHDPRYASATLTGAITD